MEQRKGRKRKLLVEEQEEHEAKRVNLNIVNAEESEDDQDDSQDEDTGKEEVEMYEEKGEVDTEMTEDSSEETEEDTDKEYEMDEKKGEVDKEMTEDSSEETEEDTDKEYEMDEKKGEVDKEMTEDSSEETEEDTDKEYEMDEKKGKVDKEMTEDSSEETEEDTDKEDEMDEKKGKVDKEMTEDSSEETEEDTDKEDEIDEKKGEVDKEMTEDSSEETEEDTDKEDEMDEKKGEVDKEMTEDSSEETEEDTDKEDEMDEKKGEVDKEMTEDSSEETEEDTDKEDEMDEKKGEVDKEMTEDSSEETEEDTDKEDEIDEKKGEVDKEMTEDSSEETEEDTDKEDEMDEKKGEVDKEMTEDSSGETEDDTDKEYEMDEKKGEVDKEMTDDSSEETEEDTDKEDEMDEEKGKVDKEMTEDSSVETEEDTDKEEVEMDEYSNGEKKKEETECGEESEEMDLDSSGEEEDGEEEVYSVEESDEMDVYSNGEEEEVDSEDEEKEEMKENQTDLPAKGEQQPLAKNEQMYLKRLPDMPSLTDMPVNRTAEVQAARLRLPILAEEQQVMELINEHPIVIIAGATGSGKTTQVPQFLYEAGYALNKMIGITEPRRVAAISMSQRVAHEMNLPSSEVSYLLRFEGNVTPATKIKFMTDGVLLKEIETDFLLSKYSVIVLDEAHERTSNTDILIGLLSRIVPLRNKRGNELKLIIMSATLRVSDFTENTHLFKVPPPLIKVEARQFPVIIHFQKHTPEDYLQEAFRKTVKIHAKLPEGGILIFVTGQLEVMRLVRKLRKAFPYGERKNKLETKTKQQPPDKPDKQEEAEKGEERALDEEFDKKRKERNPRKRKPAFPYTMPKINLDDYKLPGDDTEADVHEQANPQGSDNEDEGEEQDIDDLANLQSSAAKQPMWVLPLFSLLSSEKQQRIFQPVPEGCRLCVVATNIAETSLTIPHVKYVVDCGKQKTRLYDKITGVSTFVVTYTSKASADQRAGRAGRISAGHCYRLYSSAVYNDIFPDFSPPDILQKPVDDLMLKMRCMGIDRIINFPFPSPPDQEQLKAAEYRLLVLGALEPPSATDGSEGTNPPRVTRLGETVTCFPVAPRFGKVIALSTQRELMPYTVNLVAALSVPELFIHHSDLEQGDEQPKLVNRRPSSLSNDEFHLLGDPMLMLRAVCVCDRQDNDKDLIRHCEANWIRYNAMKEVRKLRSQLVNAINVLIPDINLFVNPKLPPPSSEQARALRQILLAGMGDKVARKVPLEEISDKEERRRLRFAYNCADMEEPAFLHSASVLKAESPDWVIYQDVFELQHGDSTKIFLTGITAIQPEWLLVFVPHLCNVHEVYEDPPPRYYEKNGRIFCNAKVTFGKAGWELPLCEHQMPFSERTCCYFAMFLLDGLVCPALAAFKRKLKSSPSSFIKSWSDLNDKVVRFKRALINKKIFSREALFNLWDTEPDFLLDEYHQLLYNVPLSELTKIWPPMEEDEDSSCM